MNTSALLFQVSAAQDQVARSVSAVRVNHFQYHWFLMWFIIGRMVKHECACSNADFGQVLRCFSMQ